MTASEVKNYSQHRVGHAKVPHEAADSTKEILVKLAATTPLVAP